jgi:hypothetical protein
MVYLLIFSRHIIQLSHTIRMLIQRRRLYVIATPQGLRIISHKEK